MKSKRMASIFLCIVLTFSVPVSAFAAENVPQKILDLRSSIVRVVAQNNKTGSMGTGFALGLDKVQYIATNYHVVDGMSDIVVWYGNKTFSPATVAAKLPDSDLCVLKLSDPLGNMASMTIDDRNDTKAGDAVYALGFPGATDMLFSSDLSAGPDEVTVTSGNISSLKSNTMMEGGREVKLYQIDVAINHGNSGGPLLNQTGEVIGVTSYGDDYAQNVNAAIRISELIPLLKENNIPYKTPEQPQQPNPDYTWAIILACAVGGGVAALVIVLAVRRRKYGGKAPKGKAQPLETWLMNMGGRAPFEMALYLLEPAIRSLAVLHASGVSRLNIGMDSIWVRESGQAALAEDARKKGAEAQTLKPGYAAPEQYRTGGDIGPWCDVYAVAALLYRLVMGKPLPDAFSRMEYDADVQQDIAGRNIDENKKSAWLQALNLKPEERFHSCGMMAEALYATGGAPIYAEAAQAEEPQPEGAPWPAAQPYAYVQAEPAKTKKKFRKRWIAVIVAGALAVAVCGYYGYLEATYQEAAKLTEQKEYQQAIDKLEKIPDNYKDAQTMDYYNFACLELSQENYDTAQQWFEKLGDYRDSKTMLTEVAYGRAKDKLEDAKYDDAKTAFANLGDYKDAKDMVFEADYRKAEDMISREEYLDAYHLLQTIKDYPEAKKAIETVQEDIYNKAVDLYRKFDNTNSHGFFAELPKEYKDTTKYLELLDICMLEITPARYETLKTLIGFEDATDILIKSGYVYYYLEGKWKDANGSEFDLARNDKGGWDANASFANNESMLFDIQDGAIRIGTSKEYMRSFVELTFVSLNEVQMFVLDTAKTYDFIRN